MSVFKQFNTNEVVITPFHANKGFQFIGSQITASDVGIEYYQSMQGPYVTGSHPTGFGTILDEVLVFSSIKQLYYSNYLTSSTGDNLTTSSVVPGYTPEFNSFVGPTTGPRFENFLQSSIQQNRQFAQFSASTAIEGPSVISIPSKLFGEKIPPSTFNFTYTSSNSPYIESFVYDDSEGNLLATQYNPLTSNTVYTGSVGQIFYSQGMAVLTGVDEGDLTTFATLVGSNGVAFGALTSGLSVLYATSAGGAFNNMGSVAGPFTVTPLSAVTFGTAQNGAGASFSITNGGGSGTVTAISIVATGAYYVDGNFLVITEEELLAAGFTGVVGNLSILLQAIRIVTPNDNLTSASLAFSSSITIRENQYKCTVRDNEYSYTYNPSALRPSNQLSMVNNQLSSSILPSQTSYPDDGAVGTYILGYLSSSPSIGEGGTATVTIETSGAGTTVSNITTSFPGTAYAVGDIILLDMGQQSGGSNIIPGANGFIGFQLTSADISYPADFNSLNSTYYDFATGSDFSPYVTTIGLYNETNQLVAVGKLPRPLPISLYTDTTFVVNFDT